MRVLHLGVVYYKAKWYNKIEVKTMPEMKRTVKDSVFTYLFSDPKYACELYQYLHPEDTSVTEQDCKLVTIQNILSNGQYNDLGLLIRDTLIILAEAQSTFFSQCANPGISVYGPRIQGLY